jgi:hypothetical protein
MTLKCKFFVVGIINTIGCYILTTRAYPLSALIFCMPALMISWRRYNDPIRFRLPKWNPEGFLIGALICVSIYLVCLLVAQIPDDKFMSILKKWYFIVPLWICSQLSVLLGYYKEKKAAQPINSADAKGRGAD